MKEYESPKADFVGFGNSRVNTASSKCNCYAENWDYEEFDIDDPEAVDTGCKMVTRDFYEIADAVLLE